MRIEALADAIGRCNERTFNEITDSLEEIEAEVVLVCEYDDK